MGSTLVRHQPQEFGGNDELHGCEALQRQSVNLRERFFCVERKHRHEDIGDNIHLRFVRSGNVYKDISSVG